MSGGCFGFRRRLTGGHGGRHAACVLAFALAVGACGSSGHRVPTPPPTSATTVPAPTTSATTTVPGPQTSGPRTVLSPLGLNVRATPSTAAKILGTADQGTVLTVLSHSPLGWFEVKGATVTGWITDSSTLSAAGKFATYTSGSNVFAALYPAGWTVAETPTASVVFRAPSSPDTVVVTAGTTVAQLGSGRTGYHLVRSAQVVVCGVTSQLVTYTDPSVAATTDPAATAAALDPQPYLLQVRLTLDAQHALGLDANLAALSQQPGALDIFNSVTFPFPQCQP
jgi:hypothetical protein